MSSELGVGVIGCGNISTAYFTLSKLFRGIKMVACADIDKSAAKAQGDEFGLKALTVDSLLKDKSIDIVVNLTVPSAHFEVSKRILQSGKHVFSEKPFVLSLNEGQKLQKIARKRSLLVASAPDTFLGGAHQLARHLVDKQTVGRITSGSCHVMSHGMEHWHPNPDFFFKEGGGPVLDICPYYISNLVNLIGPVKNVLSMGAIPTPKRTIGYGKRKGQKIDVETPTTILGLLRFKSGALVSLSASWDVWAHWHNNIELYGENGSLLIPDPNFFGGDVYYTKTAGKKIKPRNWKHPLSVANQEQPFGKIANYRTIGLAEMADSIVKGRTPRCSLDFALHVIDVLTGLLKSSKSGESVKMKTKCKQPRQLSAEDALSLMNP